MIKAYPTFMGRVLYLENSVYLNLHRGWFKVGMNKCSRELNYKLSKIYRKYYKICQDDLQPKFRGRISTPLFR